MSSKQIEVLLNAEVEKRNTPTELTPHKPDPLLVAKRYNNETIALICALFAYGSAKAIVAFLESLDFTLLEESESTIKEALQNHYYRFQKGEDVVALFIALKRLKERSSLENIFYQGYCQERDVLKGLASLISAIEKAYEHKSRGYRFLIGTPPTSRSTSPYKRYLMFLRWMVRDDQLDMGLWSSIDTKDLLMPLDTHTFHVARKLGLLTRKSYDLKAVVELTERLKCFDEVDPIKYDFALYRLGQEGVI
jgi:uncharacterized protein (TIGR02757 family)